MLKNISNSTDSRFSVGGVAQGATGAVNDVAGGATGALGSATGGLGQSSVGQSQGGANKIGKQAPQKQGGGALAPVEGIVGGAGNAG